MLPSDIIKKHIEEVLLPNDQISSISLNWKSHDFTKYSSEEYEIVSEIGTTKTGKKKYLVILLNKIEQFRMSNCLSIYLKFEEAVIFDNKIASTFKTYSADITIWLSQSINSKLVS
jgi:hypothetical protein